MLAYTFDRLTTHLAWIERNFSGLDEYGGQRTDDWQPYLQVPGRYAPAKGVSSRSVNRTYVSPNRDAPVQEGLLLVATGTDVTEADRLGKITKPDGTLLFGGPFIITAVVEFESHLELTVFRAHLGV